MIINLLQFFLTPSSSSCDFSILPMLWRWIYGVIFELMVEEAIHFFQYNFYDYLKFTWMSLLNHLGHISYLVEFILKIIKFT